MALVHLERPADGDAAGLLILHHGRGSDEQDLLGLADVLDPQRRLHVITPRAPLRFAGQPGHHWYAVPRVGYPDPGTFGQGYAELAAFHDETWARTGIGPERTVLGGFSQGSVMSFALGLPAERPLPAGLLVMSGFIPTVEGWEADLESRARLAVFQSHGRRDPVIDVSFARRDHARLTDAGLPIDYHETDVGHHIDPALIPAATRWLSQTVPAK
jgi:phospholipase/carboxylesterase